MKKLRNDLKGLIEALESTDYKTTPGRLMPGAPLKIEMLAPMVHDPLRLLDPTPSQEDQEANMDFWKDNSK